MRYWFLLLILIGSATATTTMRVVAIDEQKNGQLLDMDVEVVPGKGRILLSSLPFTGIDTQLSERQAVEYALHATGEALGERDILFTFKANVQLVEGQSAGAAMALGVIGELQGKTPRQDVVVTGAIGPDGTMVGVSGVLEKAMAAGMDDINVFVIPPGTAKIIQPFPKERTVRGLRVKYAEPVVLDVAEYAEEHWDLEVREASNIDEAMTIVFGVEKPRTEASIGDITLEPRAERSPLASTGEDFLRWAETLEANETELEKARQYLSEGHEYAGANEAFLAWVDRKTDLDLEQLAQDKYSIEEEFETLQGQIEEIGFPEGYNVETINWHVGAQQRYIWAGERLAKLRDSEPSDEELAYNLNLVRGWLHIARSLLQHTKPGNLTFNIGLVPLVDGLVMDANEEIVAALMLGEDTYGAIPIINSIEAEKAKGWYLPAGYDAINAMARASSYDSEENQARVVGLLEGLDEKVKESEALGLGFWPDMYLDGAHTAIVEGDYAKAYIYAKMAHDFAEFEQKAMAMQDQVPVKTTITEQVIKEVQKAKKLAETPNLAERVVEKIFEFFEMLLSK